MSEALTAAIERHLPKDDEDFAFALSGGPDSLGLFQFLSEHPRLKVVLHVDHGLREESACEAERVAKLAKTYGHDLQTLVWSPGELSSGLQEKARRARYRLMGEACRKQKISVLVTAHHADDQAETVLMRLQRGSGWRGAAGMAERHYAPVWPELAGITVVRPALGVSRKVLHKGLSSQPYISDSSNHDRRFNRVRVRQELSGDTRLREDMLSLAEAMQRGRDVERDVMARDLEGVHLTHEGLLTVPRLVRPATLAMLAPIVGGQGGPSDRNRIAKIHAGLQSGKRTSIGSGALAQWTGQTLVLSRDPVAMTGRNDGNLEATAIRREIGPTPRIWDGRFLVRGGGGIIQPERRGSHIGYRILYGRDVRVENLVERRLQAALTGM